MEREPVEGICLRSSLGFCVDEKGIRRFHIYLQRYMYTDMCVSWLQERGVRHELATYYKQQQMLWLCVLCRIGNWARRSLADVTDQL